MPSNIRTYVDQNREEESVRLADDAADAALQAEIDQIESSVGLETDGTLVALGGNYTSGSTLKAAVLSVDSQVKTNADNITTLGDPSAMQNEIDAIETGAGLSSTGTYTVNSSSNYMKTSTSIVDATEDLDAQIKINTDAIAAEVSNRTSGDSTIQSELDVTQTGAGLSSTGAYSANGSANYISLATSLVDADNKLDAALHSLSLTTGNNQNYVIKTSNYSAISGDQILANTSSNAWTLTLPTSPSANDFVDVADYSGDFETNNLTINRNGKNIMGDASDLICDVNYFSGKLLYVDITEGWIIV